MRLTRPDKGWSWVVMVASFFIHGLNGSILYGAGIIQVSLLDRFNRSVSLTSWAGGIFIFFMSSAGVIGSWIINRWGCRTAFLIGSVIMTSGLIACVFVKSLSLIFLVYGFVAGSGSGIIYTTGIVVVGLNFEKKRSIATGFASCGAGVGVFILSPVIQLAREQYGNCGVFFVMAGIALNMSVFGALCFPSYLEYYKVERHLADINLSVSSLSLSKKKRIYERVKVFANIPFFLICLSLFSSHVGIYLMYVHLPNFAISRGTSGFEASFLMSITGIMNCVSRLFIGFAGNSEHISTIILYFGTFSLLGISTMLFPFYGSNFVGQAIYAAFLGTYSGCCYVLLATITPNLVGLKNLATAFGIEMTFTGVGTLIGPPIAGFILDSGGTYEASFFLAGSSAIIAAVLGLASEVFHQVSHPTEAFISPENDKLFKEESQQQCDGIITQ
ncbi:monocarboxylate transporter 9-like [Ylistrum balloti]|uniref:monocarboxylate transporter 9-like n=1 Tax=Ylistrum balloti TaxID=509963 RepID=UPI002905BAEC|nr:monocarboxylate transporter 9-like [Ylistrum balloti]